MKIERMRQLIESAPDQLPDGKPIGQDLIFAIMHALRHLNEGTLRVTEKQSDGTWIIHSWLKKAILLFFQIFQSQVTHIDGLSWYDKLKPKFLDWNEEQFKKTGIRAAVGAMVRYGAYIGPQTVLMPSSFVNIGAYIDESSMIDSNATVGSCAQIGKRVHVSAGAVIGGVLEPINAHPVIIEDDCFVGANTCIVEGVMLGEGSVIGMGVRIGASTPIVDRKNGKIHKGYVPPHAVVVPGVLPTDTTLPNGIPVPALSCAVIVKYVDAKTRAKININNLLHN